MSMDLESFSIQNLDKNCNETLILSILYSHKKHGYQLAVEIEERSKGTFKFNHGTPYPILHKLEKEKLIKSKWKQEAVKKAEEKLFFSKEALNDIMAVHNTFFTRLSNRLSEPT